jgi:hypothetical protein
LRRKGRAVRSDEEREGSEAHCQVRRKRRQRREVRLDEERARLIAK